MTTEAKKESAKKVRQAMREAGIPRRGRKSNSEKAVELEGSFESKSDTTFNRGRVEQPLSSSPSILSPSASSQSLGGFSSSASSDLNYALGMTTGDTMMFGPEYLGNLGYKLADDTSDDQITLLKQIYNVSTREELIIKLQERMGLRAKTVHPLLKYRQSSFMDVQQNHYDCGIERYVFPLEGNVKSTL